MCVLYPNTAEFSVHQQGGSKINWKEFLQIHGDLKSCLWILKEQGSIPLATHRYESGGVPSDGACIWRPCHTRCIWTCGCRPLGWAVGAVREGEKERDSGWRNAKKEKKTSWGESSVNKSQLVGMTTSNKPNEASWLSIPTSAERLQAAAAITERITYLLISWLLSQRRHAFRIWQPRK